MTRARALWACAFLLVVGCGKDEPTPAAPPATPRAGTGAGSGTAAPSAPAAGGYGYGYAAALGEELDRRVGDALAKGKRYLLGKRDAAKGTWAGPAEAGVTALVAAAIVGTLPREVVKDDPVVRQALDALAAAQKPDGSIFTNPQYVNYETSAAILAFATARSAAHAAAQGKARDFLASSQVADDPSNPSFGGFPYQSKRDPSRPTDLSNQQFALTALHEAGLPKDHVVWKRSLEYLARVQNRSETNTYRAKTDEGEVVSGNDGGAVYAPGVSMAGPPVKRPDGALEVRSYGSMTYALVKCLLFAGAKADDPRVRAAIGWLERNFTVDRNPGRETADDPEKAGQEGYYYYLLTMARAAAEYEKATAAPWRPKDAAGAAHDWRRELAGKLASLQQPDGSWKNPVDRWEEADPVIVTAYAVQTLAICQGRLP